MEKDVDYYLNNKCSTKHQWICNLESGTGEIPEGMPCECGEMISHYDKCHCCGSRIFKPIKKDK